MNPASTDGDTEFGLFDANAGAEMTALIPVQPGNFTVTEKPAPTGWLLDSAACVRQGVATGTRSGSQVSGIGVTIGETTVCTFHNVIGAPDVEVTKTAEPTTLPETGGDVTCSVDVHNPSLLPVTLTSLTDDIFGDLNGKGTCAISGTIAAGGTYSCEVTETLAAGGRHQGRASDQCPGDGRSGRIHGGGHEHVLGSRDADGSRR